MTRPQTCQPLLFSLVAMLNASIPFNLFGLLLLKRYSYLHFEENLPQSQFSQVTHHSTLDYPTTY